MVNPNVGVFLGYKCIDLESKDKWQNRVTGATGTDDAGDITLSGFGFGVTGNRPVKDNVILYRGFALTFLV